MEVNFKKNIVVLLLTFFSCDYKGEVQVEPNCSPVLKKVELRHYLEDGSARYHGQPMFDFIILVDSSCEVAMAERGFFVNGQDTVYFEKNYFSPKRSRRYRTVGNKLWDMVDLWNLNTSVKETLENMQIFLINGKDVVQVESKAMYPVNFIERTGIMINVESD